jgi:hypothetical protein
MHLVFLDLKFVFRQLRKSLGFTAAAVLMLAFAKRDDARNSVES